MDQPPKRTPGFLPERKKMEALGRVSCKLAHDFNNILGAIEGYATLAMNSVKKDDPLMPDLQEIRASVAKAAAIGKQLIIFGGRQMFHKAACDVNAIITNTLKRAELAPGGDLRIEARLEPGLPGVVADAAQLEQALVNLLVNARDAMSPADGAKPDGGTVVITSSALRMEEAAVNSPAPQEAGHLFIKISVRDSGGGISAEALERLFEPFFSTKERGRGSGFGLSLVYGVVKLHNGWVEVKSEPGRGSEFSLFLPVS